MEQYEITGGYMSTPDGYVINGILCIREDNKAREMVTQFLDISINESLAKRYALIAVDEILATLPSANNVHHGNPCTSNNLKCYWEEVKKEIMKL